MPAGYATVAPVDSAGWLWGRATVALLAWLVLTDVAAGQTGTAVPESVKDDALLAEQLEASIEAASAAVVRIKIATKYARSGVIVSEDGYVVWPGAPHPQPQLSVALPSGETVTAVNLGWSTEWHVGLLKLQGDRLWDHASWGSTKAMRPGEPCVELGYHAIEGHDGEFTPSPIARCGRLQLVSETEWFTTTLPPIDFEYGAGIFDTRGNLLGVTVPGVTIQHHQATAIEVVASHWQDFKAAKNLDWVRFPPSENSLYRRLAPADRLATTGILPRSEARGFRDVQASDAIDNESFRLAQEKAAKTTVRIRADSNPASLEQRGMAWSGVVVSDDGLVATCAHTGQIPGEILKVVLPSGRDVPAIALGSNWASDVGLIQITAPGPWDFAEFGDSSTIPPGGAVLCAGFPVPDSDPLPAVTTVLLPLQLTRYVSWNRELMFAASLDLPGGASGGGVFDREGKLVAVYTGPSSGHRVEMLRAEMEQLKNAKPMLGAAAVVKSSTATSVPSVP